MGSRKGSLSGVFNMMTGNLSRCPQWYSADAKCPIHA